MLEMCYRGFTNTARRTYQKARRWVSNRGRSISRSVQNGAHRVIRQVRNIAQDKEKMEMIRTIVGIVSIAAIAIPVVPAIAVTILGVIELGLDLAEGNNIGAATCLLSLFPLGKGIKMVTGIGGDGLKGAREGKNLYKIATKGPLEMNLQKFGNAGEKISWIMPKSLPLEEEQAVLNTLKYIDNGTKPSSSLAKRWGIKFGNYQQYLPNGKYVEYRVSPPVGTTNAGARRIVQNVETGELYYTWTHYGDAAKPAFVRIR
ncbi:ribonuclease domain-containing protein [Clostridium sp. Marseille-Q2269]|uniref:ribonuclease domain-containing protein n=1 Tax=Clostridium sp. Marseille-Q2269 TaxID=2942205 RepID=UPI002073B48A|nr:ribonuclease domain-containing protein [Clostridium sp. Marseille-Q2269]